MKKKIGAVLIIFGCSIMAGQYVTDYLQTEKVQPIHTTTQKNPIFSNPVIDQNLSNNQDIPHVKYTIEVSEEEAKRLREEAGYSSEGVTGGVIVGYKKME